MNISDIFSRKTILPYFFVLFIIVKLLFSNFKTKKSHAIGVRVSLKVHANSMEQIEF